MKLPSLLRRTPFRLTLLFLALFALAAIILFVVPPLVYYCYSYYTSL